MDVRKKNELCQAEKISLTFDQCFDLVPVKVDDHDDCCADNYADDCGTLVIVVVNAFVGQWFGNCHDRKPDGNCYEYTEYQVFHLEPKRFSDT